MSRSLLTSVREMFAEVRLARSGTEPSINLVSGSSALWRPAGSGPERQIIQAGSRPFDPTPRLYRQIPAKPEIATWRKD